MRGQSDRKILMREEKSDDHGDKRHKSDNWSMPIRDQMEKVSYIAHVDILAHVQTFTKQDRLLPHIAGNKTISMSKINVANFIGDGEILKYQAF